MDKAGKPRLNDFIDEIILYAVRYAVPRSRIEKAFETGNPAEIVRLDREARTLFTYISNSGEGGELLLYLLAECLLKLPQLLCKMPLKTNTAMHYHGSDGVHVGVNESTGNLALYWGEAKLHKTVSAAVASCLEDIAPYLLDQGGSKSPQARDLQLVRDHLDLNDQTLEDAIRTYLDKSNANYNSLEFRGLGLVGFDNDSYPVEPNKKTIEALSAELTAELEGWKGLCAKGIDKEKISSFHLELFCFPFPSVDEYRTRFKSVLGLVDGQE